MILCLNCKRLSPSGTVYCGGCGSSLGKRICGEGHESDVSAQYCAMCGSASLSRGARSINFRLGTLVLTCFAAWAALKVAGVPLWHVLYANFMIVLVRVLDVILGLAVWSWLIGLVLGEHARKIIADLWRSVFNLIGRIASNLAAFVATCIVRRVGK